MDTSESGQRRRLAILGSTGSIGKQTLDVVRAFPEAFQVVALVARNNIELLAEQVREFHPTFVACTSTDQGVLRRGRELLPDLICSADGLLAAAAYPDSDMVVVAMSGVEGVKPTLAALTAGKQVALANKETLVLAGHLVRAATPGQDIPVLPIDSEHSAIWQCLRGEQMTTVRRLLLTASGGPFRQASFAEMSTIGVEQALAHPTWSMGPKITIDSATLMNKGLEVIEAHWLFAVPYANIAVVVHPQSIIHSMVEFIDDSIKMQASLPSMHLPIQDALSYPKRFDRTGTTLARELRWSEIAQLHFEDVDHERFPCLGLALAAGRLGGTAPAVLTGADEQAVALFLQGRLRLTEIAPLVEQTLSRHTVIANPSVETVIDACSWAQDEVLRLCQLSNKSVPAPHVKLANTYASAQL
jgi:1-deoxy-D-xylulose-5-phosphate reductoisomerase